jgi:hypothetical protein
MKILKKITPSVGLAIGVIAVTFSLSCIYYTINVAATGINKPAIFADIDDRFGDLLKISMANIDITKKCVEEQSANFQNWPELYKFYLLRNPYLFMYSGFGVSNAIYQFPPLSLLYTRIVAHEIVLFGPTGALIQQFIIYFSLVLLAAVFVKKSLFLANKRTLLFAFLFLCSMPVLTSYSRGHFYSAYAGLAVVLYILTVYANRCRYFGIIMLAIAINIRPNLIVFLIMETLSAKGLRGSIKNFLVAGMSIGFFYLFSYIFINKECPDYNISSWLSALHAYSEVYIKNDSEISFGCSILGFVRTIRWILKMHPYYTVGVANIINCIGIIYALILVMLHISKILDPLKSSYLCACYTALFCPYFGHYHFVIFAAPLILSILPDSRKKYDSDTLIIYFSSLACLSCMYSLEYYRIIFPIILLPSSGYIIYQGIKRINIQDIIGFLRS